MHRIFRSPSSIRLPRSSAVEKNNEYSRQHKGIEVCPDCKNAHYKKRWYSSIKEIISHVRGKKPEVTDKKYCPACLMKRNNSFEGELVLQNIQENNKREILRLIRSFGDRAKQMDPQDRVLSVSDNKEAIRVLTSENQLAEKLGKKMREVFRNVALQIKHSREPYEVTRVWVKFE
jgi:NMD protein affecting ribosome stability and mRNA decay